MRLFGILFVCLIATIPFLMAEIYVGNGYLQNFIKNQSVEIMGIILALNVTTSTFLITHLNDIEIQSKKRIFDDTITEIKHNIVFMFIVFVLNISVIFFTPKCEQVDLLCYILFEFNLLFFALYVYALWDMTCAIFSIRKNHVCVNNNENT